MAVADRADAAVDHVPWSSFLGGLDWRQGEHVSIVGPTGQGKTTLAHALLPRRRYVVVLATKPKDATLDRLVRAGGYRVIREWPPPAPPDLMPRVVLWPRWRDASDTLDQAHVIRDALNGVFAEGAWCVYADELYYVADLLNLGGMLRLLWQQGRSLGVSVVGSTQRPAWVPLEMYSQATHVFFFRHSDRRDLDRISGLGNFDPADIRRRVRSLDPHVALYVNTRTDEMVTTKVEV